MKNLRIKKGMTQKQLGNRIGVSQVYISRIENGDIEGLTIGKLIKISHVLKISPNKLLKKLLKIKNKKNFNI